MLSASRHAQLQENSKLLRGLHVSTQRAGPGFDCIGGVVAIRSQGVDASLQA